MGDNKLETQAWICPKCFDDHSQEGECTVGRIYTYLNRITGAMAFSRDRKKDPDYEPLATYVSLEDHNRMVEDLTKYGADYKVVQSYKNKAAKRRLVIVKLLDAIEKAATELEKDSFIYTQNAKDILISALAEIPGSMHFNELEYLKETTAKDFAMLQSQAERIRHLEKAITAFNISSKTILPNLQAEHDRAVSVNTNLQYQLKLHREAIKEVKKLLKVALHQVSDDELKYKMHRFIGRTNLDTTKEERNDRSE